MTIDELRKDLEGLVAHANQLAGAIQYIRQKIASLEKAAKEPEARPQSATENGQTNRQARLEQERVAEA